MVGAAGFEPATPCTPCRYATGLRYAPTLQPAYHSGEYRYKADKQHVDNILTIDKHIYQVVSKNFLTYAFVN